MCGEEQRNSGNISIEITDIQTNKPVNDVKVMFACGDETCSIGETDSKGRMESKFPVCINGAITFFKQDYFIPGKQITTKLDEKQSFKIDAIPILEKEVYVNKWVYSQQFQQIAPNPVDLDQQEEAVIILTRIAQVNGEDEFVAISTFWGNQTGPSKIKLVPGTYEVRITNIMHKTLLIPAEKREEGGVMGIGKTKYTIPEIKIEDQYPNGGAQLTNSSGYLVIKNIDLFNKDKINFYTISPTTPLKVEDLEAMGATETLSTTFRQNLEPVYS